MKVIAIGAHCDDVEIGCGGTLLTYRDQGHELVILTMTDSAFNSPTGVEIRLADQARAEAEDAATRLGARLIMGDHKCFELASARALGSEVAGIVEQVGPDLAFIHWPGDPHADHAALAAASLHATRRVPRVLAYRTNWDTGTVPFDGRIAVDITSTVSEKIELIGCYASENARTGGAWQEFALARSQTLGKTHGVEYAEVFEPVRYLLP